MGQDIELMLQKMPGKEVRRSMLFSSYCMSKELPGFA